jgi:hypothetical protein
MATRRKAKMEGTVTVTKGKLRFKLLPGSTWVSSPPKGERKEYHDGDLIDADLDAENKPVHEDLRVLVDLGLAVVEG